ncbi:MAG: hypothetical protein KBT02_07995 [Treponema sp.]|nr:hypothetical protein [Candidatus Treponema caballi]
MKKSSGEKKNRGSLPGFIIYEVIIVALMIAVTARFCKIGLSVFGLYTVLINAVLIILGVVVYLAGFGRIQKFFSSRTNWAVILLIIPIIISFTNISGTITKRFLFWSWNEQFITSITPSLMSTLFAILLLLAVILRNNPRRMFSKPSRFVMLAGDVLFISSFLNILCNKEMLPIPGINMSCQALLIVAIGLSWVGIREVAGIIWIIVLILGVTRLCSIDSVMGFTGSLYLLSAFISGVLQWLEFDVHFSLDGLKQQFSTLNADAASLLSKDGERASFLTDEKPPVVELTKENEPVSLPEEEK